MKSRNNLISIIIPCYNCEKSIEKAINSVLNQTYSNFEILCVDDCSIDDTNMIIRKFAEKDDRIKLFKFKTNMGAASARNYGLKKAKGRYIAYLDSDDVWENEKLEKQISFMINNSCAFSCHNYVKVNDKGDFLKIIKMPKIIDYNLYLRNTIIQTSTTMIDVKKVSKKYCVMPNLKIRQDAATWLSILKQGFICYGIQENLSYYKTSAHSLSSNKFKAALGTWKLYRDIEKISFSKSCFYFLGYAYNAIRKRIYIKKILKVCSIKE